MSKLNEKIEREVALYLGGRGGVGDVGPHLIPLGVTFTGGGGAGDLGDGFFADFVIDTPEGRKLLKLKISVDDYKRGK